MQLKDYLNAKIHSRRILIVSDISRGQALIRLHEKQTGEMVCNVSCMTIPQMADAVYRYLLSAEGYNERYEFLDNTAAMMLFRGIIIDNIKSLRYFNNERVMDIATTSEIFSKANLIRANRWSGEEAKEKNDRVTDLKFLISEYEEKLAANDQLDEVAKEKLVLSKLNAASDISAEIKTVFSAEISYLAEDVTKLNGIEEELLAVFANATDPVINVFDDGLSMSDLSNCVGKASFYKGYGSFNEASYIANDILAKNIAFGNVSVLYSSDNQLPAITAALRGNGIPMNILTNYSAKDNTYISLAKRIIEWAASDYSEKKLEEILSSPVITVNADDGAGNKINALSGQKYYDYVLNARDRREDSFVLGWGYKRNALFVEHEKLAAKENSVIEILKMHEALLGIFGDMGKPYDDNNKVRPITLYEKLVAFLEEYSCNGSEYAVGIDNMRRLSGAIRFEERALPLKDTMEFIDGLLCGIKISDAATNDSVTVQALNGWKLLDRPNVYLIGLSLKDMQTNTTESPVLSDAEMERFLANGYAPTIENSASIYEKNFLFTLQSFNGEALTFGYSSYDTVSFCENNASGFFREALEVFGDCGIDALPEFVYGNPTGTVGTSSVTAWKDKAVYDVRHVTSSSSIEMLLDCPKKYAYDMLMHIPDNEFSECDFGRWLDAKNKGSFFHELFEKYCLDRLILSAAKPYENVVDETFVRRIAKEIEKEMLIKVPCAFEALADRETEDIVKAAVIFIQKLLDELNTAMTWRILMVEQKFSDATYPIEGFDGNIINFNFTGYIDRIDYRIDKTGKKCFLRIVDYKTGKSENKETENELGKLMQYAIYEKAVMDTGKVENSSKGMIPLLEYIRNKVADLEGDSSLLGYQFEFESFQYEFPLDTKNEDRLETINISSNELEGINITRLKAIMAILGTKHIYPDHKELREGLQELVTMYPSEEDNIKSLLGILEDNKAEAKNCEYCSYKYLCNNRKVGEIK